MSGAGAGAGAPTSSSKRKQSGSSSSSEESEGLLQAADKAGYGSPAATPPLLATTSVDPFDLHESAQAHGKERSDDTEAAHADGTSVDHHSIATPVSTLSEKAVNDALQTIKKSAPKALEKGIGDMLTTLMRTINLDRAVKEAVGRKVGRTDMTLAAQQFLEKDPAVLTAAINTAMKERIDENMRGRETDIDQLINAEANALLASRPWTCVQAAKMREPGGDRDPSQHFLWERLRAYHMLIDKREDGLGPCGVSTDAPPGGEAPRYSKFARSYPVCFMATAFVVACGLSTAAVGVATFDNQMKDWYVVVFALHEACYALCWAAFLYMAATVESPTLTDGARPQPPGGAGSAAAAGARVVHRIADDIVIRGRKERGREGAKYCKWMSGRVYTVFLAVSLLATVGATYMVDWHVRLNYTDKDGTTHDVPRFWVWLERCLHPFRLLSLPLFAHAYAAVWQPEKDFAKDIFNGKLQLPGFTGDSGAGGKSIPDEMWTGEHHPWKRNVHLGRIISTTAAVPVVTPIVSCILLAFAALPQLPGSVQEPAMKVLISTTAHFIFFSVQVLLYGIGVSRAHERALARFEHQVSLHLQDTHQDLTLPLTKDQVEEMSVRTELDEAASRHWSKQLDILRHRVDNDRNAAHIGPIRMRHGLWANIISVCATLGVLLLHVAFDGDVDTE